MTPKNPLVTHGIASNLIHFLEAINHAVLCLVEVQIYLGACLLDLTPVF